jgi:hypothetical protein
MLLWAALVLAQDVDKTADAYRARTAALIARAAGPKSKIDEAAALALKLDETIVEELAAKLKTTPDAVRDAWKKRERTSKKVVVGDGSWALLGGQDGGLDSPAKGTPKVERDVADDLIDRNPSVLTKRKKPEPPQPVPLGKPIRTRDEWWAAATTDERRAFLEARYARASKAVEMKEETKDCAGCRGNGTVNVNRGGIGLTVLCARCHGAKSDLIVLYE